MEKLGIDLKLLIAQFINFGIFFIVIKKFIASPFIAFLKAEQKKEAEKQKAIEEIKKQEIELAAKKQKAMDDVKSEIALMLAQAKKDASLVREKMIQEAKEDASSIVEKTEKKLTEERIMLENELKERLVDASTLVVSKALNEYLSDEDQRKITNTILTRLSQNKTHYEN